MINYENEINRLRGEMNAVILAHYYQDDDIQDIADFVGDSLDLSRKATQTDADIIVFCGVRFMAESAKILNPNKVVLLPDMEAGCSLEDSCKIEDFKKFREIYPDYIALTYINSSAEVKALSDIIVTSTNAEKIINQIPKDQKILFSPDKFLGGYLAKKTGRDMKLWNGTCVVHERFSERELVKLKTRYSDAHIIAHPECPETLLNYAHHIGSTSSLIRYVKNNSNNDFIVLTEPGIIHQMKQVSPKSNFYSVPAIEGGCVSCNNCPYMKLNNIEKLYLAMENRSPMINLSHDITKQAAKSLNKMLEMSV